MGSSDQNDCAVRYLLLSKIVAFYKEMLLKVLILVTAINADNYHPFLSHLVGRFWYYHTGGPRNTIIPSYYHTGGPSHTQLVGAEGDGYQGNVDHHLHHPEDGSSQPHRVLVIPASTQLLNTVIAPTTSDQPITFPPQPSLSLVSPRLDSAVTDSLLSVTSRSSSLSPEEADIPSLQDLETIVSSSGRFPVGRVEELKPGSGRIIQSKRLVSGGGGLQSLVWGTIPLLVIIVLVI